MLQVLYAHAQQLNGSARGTATEHHIVPQSATEYHRTPRGDARLSRLQRGSTQAYGAVASRRAGERGRGPPRGGEGAGPGLQAEDEVHEAVLLTLDGGVAPQRSRRLGAQHQVCMGAWGDG